MRDKLSTKLSIHRVRAENVHEDDHNGLFVVPGPMDRKLTVMVSDKSGWDHVIVNVWGSGIWELNTSEITYVKELIFDPGEIVVEFHSMPYTIVWRDTGSTRHLWRNQSTPTEMPPGELF